jgi:hypothetical protein
MSTEREVTRIVRSWLEEGVTRLPDRVLDAVLDQVPATRQRRPPWTAWRDNRMNTYAKLVAAAAAVLIVGVVGYQMLPGRPGVGGQPTASSSPSPSPTSIVLPSPSVEGALSPGRHSLDSFAVPGITYSVPAGWKLCGDDPDETSLCYDDVLGVTFVVVQNVVSGDCAATDLQSPPVGPSVDDLAAALSSLPRITVTPAVDVSIDGVRGKELTVRPAVPPTCAVYTWASSRHTNGMSPDEANLVRILDVHGTRVVIAGNYPRVGANSAAGLALVRQVMDSVHFTP